MGAVESVASPPASHCRRAGEPGLYRTVTGAESLSVGLVAGAQLAGLKMFFGGYPITPASAILHHLSRLKEYGITTFQAEDEIAAICAAIGASYAGQLGVTSSSGPGIALKGEAMGLAVMTEMPLVIVNSQRGGPSTGLPTKTEQSDLYQAVYGRNGDAPIPVIAARSPPNARLRDRGVPSPPAHDALALLTTLYRQCAAVEKSPNGPLRHSRCFAPARAAPGPAVPHDELRGVISRAPRCSNIASAGREIAGRATRLFGRGAADMTRSGPKVAVSPTRSRQEVSLGETGRARSRWVSTYCPIHQRAPRSRSRSRLSHITSAQSRRCPKICLSYSRRLSIFWCPR